ncbi:hypothetical protein BofuT4_uP145820.1 [Botrytis cinerea T4]|uniref:Uncharacterized protein n=1 Tax=Botryotinia fuckeliana (strain T4) TaxID=999810 RepID=G2YXR5_BOTF4|nr:hypothetical protein BofuT4_uP145820.1 [Botrytis cinerea T4]
MSACQTRRISRQMWPEKVESSRQSKESRLSSSITGLQTRGKRPDGRSLSLYSSKPELILWPALDHQLSYVTGWKKLRCEEVEAWEMISAE